MQSTDQRRVKQRVGIFPRSDGENAVNRRAQYGNTEWGREWDERYMLVDSVLGAIISENSFHEIEMVIIESEYSPKW